MRPTAFAVAVVAGAAIAAAAPVTARAQEMNLAALEEARNVVQVRTGAEYGFVVGVGYARVLRFLDRPLVLGGEATLPWAKLDASDYRVRVGALIPIVGGRRWKLAGAVAPTLRGVESDISRMTNLGADLSVVGGYYGPRWFAAGELGFDWAFATHVAHADLYRANVYPDARDGWYASPGGNARAGVQGGVSFGRHDLVLRAGLVRDTAGEEPVLPFYGTLVVNTRW